MVAAIVLSDWGPPEVLVPAEIEVGGPGPGQVLIDVHFAGVGPTDLAIRAGHLKGAFGSAPGSVLGFEVAGAVVATGDDVTDVAAGDAVAAFLPELGGYGEQVLARHWVRRPDGVSEQAAAALAASGEAAARVIDETRVAQDETVLILGAAGSVGLIATQLAVSRGVRVLAAARMADLEALSALGATPVTFGPGLAAEVRSHLATVDAVIDASGAGVLATAVDLAGGAERVVTLSDPHAADFGVALSVPDEPRIAARLATVMDLMAAGHLQLRPQVVHPLADAAAVHRGLEAGELRAKVLLNTRA
jgi:NADPH:quinone reductase-like Zn-dependent oxidoreductase